MFDSPIGRHPVADHRHLLAFFIHDILIPISIVGCFLQNHSHRQNHRYVGRFMRRFTFLPILGTGVFLTFRSSERQSRLVPFSSVFSAYGLSYTCFGLEVFFSGTPRLAMQSMHVCCSSAYLYCLVELAVATELELLALLAICPFLHGIAAWKKGVDHRFCGRAFNHLGLLGTFFSLSHDSYWFFQSGKPEIHIRVMIQSVPLLLLGYYSYQDLRSHPPPRRGGIAIESRH